MQLQDSVSGVRVVVCGASEPEEEDFPPPPPDISALHIGEDNKAITLVFVEWWKNPSQSGILLSLTIVRTVSC